MSDPDYRKLACSDLEMFLGCGCFVVFIVCAVFGAVHLLLKLLASVF